MAVVAGGGQAELAVVHESAAMPVPDELDWTAAGGVPEVFTTAHDALFTQARPDGRRAAARARRRGRRRHGRGAARHDGRRARHRDRAQRARPRADRARSTCTRSRPRASRTQGPFDVILELVGAPEPGRQPQGARDARAASCVIGIGGRAPRPRSTCATLMGKRGSIHASTLRARSLEDKAQRRAARRAPRAARLRLRATSASP